MEEQETSKSAALTRATIVALLKTAEATEQSPSEVLDAATLGDGVSGDYPDAEHDDWWAGHLQAWNQQSWTTEVTEKVKRVKTIRLTIMASQIMTEAFRKDLVESTVAELLGINSLLDAIRGNLVAERSVLTTWLNHARPRRAQS